MLRGFRTLCYHPLPVLRLSPVRLAHSTRLSPADPSRGVVTLRPYQVECINAVLHELRAGTCTRLGVSAPTGSGKTATFTRLISLLPARRHPGTNELATRVLIIVNSIQLAHQTHLAVARAYPRAHVELEQGSKHKASGHADVTIATFQTLGRDGGKRLDKFDTEYYKAVIVDEAHHAVSKTYLSILSRFDPEISDSFTSASTTLSQSMTPVASPIAPAPAPAPVDEPATHADPADGELPALPMGAVDPVVMKLDKLGRPRVPLLAFSATWTRNDGLALGKVFEKIVYHAEWLDMIKSNWLSELKFTTLRISPSQGLNLDNVEVSRETGEFVLGSLAREVDREQVNEIAVQTWLEKASDRRSTLVFAISISHILSLANTFRRHGIDARFVYQETKLAERQAIYEGFKKGEFKVLVNCGILTEGADFPSIDCILLLRPTRSQSLFLQMLGRGLRLSPETGKRDCLVIDLVGGGARAGGMVCTPTLFGVDPEVEIEGQTTVNLQRLGEAQRTREAESGAAPSSRTSSESPVGREYRVEYTDFETAFDYVQSNGDGIGAGDGDDARPVHVSRVSKLAWIGCGEDVWVLELLGKGHIKIVKTRDGETSSAPSVLLGFVASLYLRLPASPFDQLAQSRGPPSPYMTPRLLALHRSLAALIRSTDRFLASKPEYASLDLARDSPWRRRPASAGQRDYLLKKLGPPAGNPREIEGIWVGGKVGTWVSVDDLTKGQASDLISRTKHGGIGHVKKFKREVERGLRDEARTARKNRKVGERLRDELEQVANRTQRV
ncbi:hypothetical protein JCM11491_000381 [Sporobolomyces phaffii]